MRILSTCILKLTGGDLDIPSYKQGQRVKYNSVGKPYETPNEKIEFPKKLVNSWDILPTVSFKYKL